MSGIYLILDNANGLLQNTDGGYPHVTLLYTGTHLCKEDILDLALPVWQTWTLQPITLSSATLNSFFHGKRGAFRHDVILHVEEADKRNLEKTRDLQIRPHLKSFPNDIGEKYIMRPPHVTAYTLWDEARAKEALEDIKTKLPITVKVLGITIK